MLFKKYHIYGIISAIIAVLIGAGCSGVLSGTFVLDYTFYDEDITANSELSYFTVDMADDEDWTDNKDDINNIDQIGFRLWIDNNGASEATPVFYMTDSMTTIFTSAQDVKDSATVILSGMTIPAGATLHVDYPTSIGYIKNFGLLKTVVETGKFTIYSVTEDLPYDLHIDSVTVIVTVTF
ncbi:MAG: hypothetical protein ABIJ45_09000 [Candidatus Zixiibacteriota bacterium]